MLVIYMGAYLFMALSWIVEYSFPCMKFFLTFVPSKILLWTRGAGNWRFLLACRFDIHCCLGRNEFVWALYRFDHFCMLLAPIHKRLLRVLYWRCMVLLNNQLRVNFPVMVCVVTMLLTWAIHAQKQKRLGGHKIFGVFETTKLLLLL